ncbi:beta-lactamase superfamily domain-containing protein [Dichotomopilus funicola]|uniref:Beta-lactamase superfamily domain-containing protein n=1 Tax=Dichotomopilus funicola TaxID=1934379 RepID=A0AAN6V702_9PEZI|nr:beta-lactamase superfamily domain-containing protein [Dichotomopilus funicola]
MEKLVTRLRLGRSLAFRPTPTLPSKTRIQPPRTKRATPVLRASASLSTVAAATASMAVYASLVSKPETPTAVPEDAELAAHHVKGRNGKTASFRNPHPSAGDIPPGPWAMPFKLAKAVFSGDLPQPSVKDITIPTVTPQFLPHRADASSPLRATWLGHACYFVEFPGGLRVLFDPVFEDRCAPVQWMGPKRYSPPACSLADLPPVDAVVISHSHYDHLSHPSVLDLAKRNPEAQFFVGLGLEKWFRDCGIRNVTEMDWWQQADLTLRRDRMGETPGAKTKEANTTAVTATDVKEDPDVILARISCLPCQHSSGRTGLDRDHTLWASWSVHSGGKSVFFGGDTGYRTVPKLAPTINDYGPAYSSLPRCPQFKQIGALRGPFDLGLIPIGAYKPRFLMSPVHANPYDAVEIFKDTRCRRGMGIHWGTWVLTSEEVEEPPRMLREALRASGIEEEGVFETCAVGETREF